MRKISADITREKGKLDRFFFAKCIGAGRAGEVMRYVPMEQLKRFKASVLLNIHVFTEFFTRK